MKKCYLIAVCAAIAAALSCSKENPDTPKMKTISVEMGCSQFETQSRTVLVGGSQVYWTAADKNILCYTTDCTTNGAPYTLSSTESTQLATKTFAGEIPEGLVPRFYYFDRNRVAGSRQVQLKEAKQAGITVDYYLRQLLDNNQRIAGAPYNTFHTGMNYAIAKPGDSSFKNALGYFKWTNNGAAIKYVRIEALTADEYLTGYFDVYYSDTEPNTILAPGVTHYAYVDSGMQDGKSIPEGTNFYAIVIPGTYHGIKLTINLATGDSFVIKDTQTITVHRGEVIPLGVLPIASL